MRFFTLLLCALTLVIWVLIILGLIFVICFRKDAHFKFKFCIVLVLGFLYLGWFYFPQKGLLDEKTIVYEVAPLTSSDNVQPNTMESNCIIEIFNDCRMIRLAWKTIFKPELTLFDEGAFIFFVSEDSYDLTNVVAACPASNNCFVRIEGQVYWIYPDNTESLYDSIMGIVN